MNSLSKSSNLIQYIVEPINKNLGRKLEAYRYHDIFKEEELTTNHNGVDIISHQLELKFEEKEPIFISWATIQGWFQYSLCVSETSFCNGVETFSKKDDNWTEIIGERLKGFDVYGYKENIITSTDSLIGRTTKETYYYEPHLLILHFGNNSVLGVANFYLENDFEPQYPMGDDVWIIFNRNKIDSYIEKLSLESLEV